MELRYAVGIESQGRMGLPENSLFVRALTWTRRLAALRVDRYIAISAEIRAGLKDSGVDDARIVSIPNGIDIKKFAPVTPDRQQALRERLALPRKARILIYTGRLAVSKGVMMLADVWRDISAEHPDTHLVLVGTGFGSIDSCEAQLLQFVAANGFADRITLPGNVSNVNEYLQASDIFLFPSDYEGFGLSILEAMAVGLPMVSTRVGVAADEVARYQPEFLVEPRRPDEFKQALRRLLGDQARQRAIGERAHGEVQARFSMAAVARRYIEVFADLTNPAPRVAPGISRNADGADLTKQ
jgi:glycosyltransferase involved in cell wall biosynthesis